MQRCLEIATGALGNTRSNPLVGCVIVHDNKIIAEGFHQVYGKEHAEVNAINALKNHSAIPDSTLYVNLEPCSHHGKTPPCADLIISMGFKKVVIASMDPNPLVNGNGIKKLKDAGIDVVVGMLNEENRQINKRFFTLQEKGRPYIVLKWAQSLDGFISPKNHQGQYKITGNLANSLVHRWRSEETGILVGRNTIERDDPQLTTRLVKGNTPDRIILDPQNKIKPHKAVHDDDARTLFYNNVGYNHSSRNVEWIHVDQENYLGNVLKNCSTRYVASIMVEGGKFTIEKFIEANLWDEARIFIGDKSIDDGIAAPKLSAQLKFSEKIGEDELQVFYNH